MDMAAEGYFYLIFIQLRKSHLDKFCKVVLNVWKNIEKMDQSLGTPDSKHMLYRLIGYSKVSLGL